LRPAFVPGVETAVCDDIKSDHSTSSPAPANPVLVEATRGRIAESVHRGRAAVVDVSGRVAAAWGDIEAPVYPRSAVKPLQALALVESGAADAFGLDDTELALTCASHSAEPRHLDGITAWLERMGLTPGDLECGAQWPLRHEPTMEALIRAGERSTGLHNNCSGKHTGMLATALHLGAPCTGYVNLEHPVQQRIMGILEQMCGYDLSGAPVARDGCSVPSFAIPLGNLARGMACFAAPDSLPDHRIAAVRRISAAMIAHPGLVEGEGRYASRLMAATRGQVIAKGGAEGVVCAALPDRGLGIAIKCDDGSARGAHMIMTGVLRALGALQGLPPETLAGFTEVPITTWNGAAVGVIHATAESTKLVDKSD
jgi:L-asparaginase II